MGFGTTQFGRSVDATYPRTACGFGAPVFGGSPYGDGVVGATVTESLCTQVAGDMTVDSWSVAVEPDTPRSAPMSRVSPRISDTVVPVDPPDTPNPDPDPVPEPVPDSVSVFGDTAFGRSDYGDDSVLVVETMSLQI